MSKVFSAKLASIEFEYEMGGKTAAFTWRAPSTLEFEQELERSEKITAAQLGGFAREKVRARLSAKGAITIDELIADQEKNGNLYEFIGELDKAVADEKNAKKRS
jgi:hypothetical protein